MRIALIQMDTAWHDHGENRIKAEAMLSRAAAEGCGVAVLPEMFASGFSMSLDEAAEPTGGPTMRMLAEASKRHSIHIIAGLALRDKGEALGRNAALVYSPEGKLIANYTKMHPFSYAGEHERYAPGAMPLVFDLDDAQASAFIHASVFICYDLRFPEAFRRVAKAASMIFMIANWPASRGAHWDALLRARAIENQCFVAGVNRTGTDGNGITYAGGSAVYGPLGEDIMRAGDEESVIVAEIDIKEVERVRRGFPFLSDMRADMGPA